MTTNRITQIFSILVALSGIAGSSWLVGPIHRQQRSLGLVLDRPIDHEAPPAIILATTSLGSFRGLAVDVLWYRANRLQQEGQFFEANQLSHWITSLQPRFPQVWSFHAWNMAYNISVATHTPQERWDWVSKGIALLRDKGIVYNPTAVRLYRELGWIYFHKIGHYMDDMQWYYKAQLAMQWQELLGELPLDATTQEAIEAFRAIVQSPDSMTQLMKSNPGVGKLLARVYRLGYRPDEALLRQIGRVAMFSDVTAGGSIGADRSGKVDHSFDEELAEILTDPEWADSVEPVLAYLRKEVLRKNYHMDPAFMLHLMEIYGPLDWRHPAAHGCYWSELGVKMASATPSDSDRLSQDRVTEIDLLNTNRQSIHALQQLAWFGRVVFDPVASRLDLLPDPRYIPAYDRAMDLAKQRIDAGEFGQVGTASFDDGHENFLLRAMTDHYLYGDMDQARYFHKKLRGLYGHKPSNRESGRYRQPLDVLVADQLRKNLDMMANTNQFIRAMLGRAFEHGLAYNQLDVFNRFVEIARLAHTSYQEGKAQEAHTSQGRLRLLPFDQVLAQSYLVFMQSSQISLLRRSQLWANTPFQLKRRVGDKLIPVLHRQAKQAGFDPALAFPQPQGNDVVVQTSIEDAGDAEPSPVRVEQK